MLVSMFDVCGVRKIHLLLDMNPIDFLSAHVGSSFKFNNMRTQSLYTSSNERSS